MITAATKLDNLLARGARPKRGILIELSAPASVGSKYLNSVFESLQSLESQIDSITEMDFIDVKQTSFSNKDCTAESLFFENLALLWSSKDQILEHLDNGINVVVIRYTFDLLLHAHANNCFGLGQLREQAAAPYLYNMFHGLPVPDVTLSFSDTPANMDRWFKNKLKRIYDSAGSIPTKEDEERLFSTKLFKREEIRGFYDRLDHVRSLEADPVSVKVTAGAIVLSRAMQNRNDLIKFY